MPVYIVFPRIVVHSSLEHKFLSEPGQRAVTRSGLGPATGSQEPKGLRGFAPQDNELFRVLDFKPGIIRLR